MRFGLVMLIGALAGWLLVAWAVFVAAIVGGW